MAVDGEEGHTHGKEKKKCSSSCVMNSVGLAVVCSLVITRTFRFFMEFHRLGVRGSGHSSPAYVQGGFVWATLSAPQRLSWWALTDDTL